MSGFGRIFSITVAAYLIGLTVAVLAILAVIDMDTISLDSGLPRSVMTTPMIAVVVFWGVARAAGSNLAPVRTFLFGGIAVYSLLYLCGRLVANAFMSNMAATVFGAVALFLMGLKMISHADQRQ